MPKIKLHKGTPSIDMTPMVDLAFLMVTFFMLASQFRAEEAVMVDTPRSVSEIQTPEKNIMLLSVDTTGRVFFGMDGTSKMNVLESVCAKYNVTLDATQKNTFSKMPNFGMNVTMLPSYLKWDKEKQSKYDKDITQNRGIPIDSTDNQLADWLYAANRESKTNQTDDGKELYDLCLKADKKTPYHVVKRVLDILKELEMNKFKMVTSLERAK